MIFEKLIGNISERYRIVLCDTDELINISKGVRHYVYCSEKGWEPENVDKIEQDKFDPVSEHYLVVCRFSDITVGTFRLIGSSDLPLNAYMPSDNMFHPKAAPKDSVCEVSRFSIIKEYRSVELLHALFLLVGYEISKKHLIGAYMVMEKSLAIRLRRNKINCRQITNSFLLNGNRSIYFCSTVECLNAVNVSLGFEKTLIDDLFKPLFSPGFSDTLKLAEL